MKETKLRHVIKAVLAEAEQAIHPQKCGLLDYGDLQRVVSQLSDTLRLTELAYDELKKEYEKVSEGHEYVPTSGWEHYQDPPPAVRYH